MRSFAKKYAITQRSEGASLATPANAPGRVELKARLAAFAILSFDSSVHAGLSPGFASDAPSDR